MSSEKTSPIRLDPRTELMLLVIANVIAFTQNSIWIEAAVITALALLLVICGQWQTACRYILIFCGMLGLQYYVIPYLPKIFMVMFYMLAVFARKLFPCLMMGVLILKTTPVRFLIIALRKWHVPQKIIIPLAITLRYFPAIREEYGHIRDAMKLRNVHGIMRKLEYRVVPLLMSATSTSDELSAAAITRGIENPTPKTCVVDLCFHVQDYISLGVGILIIAAAIVIR